MTHLWLRAEQRANEQRVALTPKGAQHLKNMGMNITVEACEKRCFSVDDYARAGCIMLASYRLASGFDCLFKAKVGLFGWKAETGMNQQQCGVLWSPRTCKRALGLAPLSNGLTACCGCASGLLGPTRLLCPRPQHDRG